MKEIDVIIIGAGASGLMCAASAGKRGRKVLVLDHASKPGNKILVSGGGKCNFTNLSVDAENYISHNRHFCKSALSRYTQWDFMDLMQSYDIAYEEREHGQLFCEKSAKDILDMLLSECEKSHVEIAVDIEISKITKENGGFQVVTSRGEYICESLVVATGGLSLPKIGASPFGYKIAKQFGINTLPTHAGLVPFTLYPEDKRRYSSLSGIAVHADVKTKTQTFSENVLFTHRGLSGPAILQASSYWNPGEEIIVNLLPDIDLVECLLEAKKENSKIRLKTVLAKYLPKRLIAVFLADEYAEMALKSMRDDDFKDIAKLLQKWEIVPNGTEGYRTAEVTVGGVDCDAVSSKTFCSKQIDGLYFIGEVLDVSGWLGGYNLQWAWSSGFCAGEYV